MWYRSVCLSLAVLLVFTCRSSSSARILGIFLLPSVSHQVIFQPIWKELSLRGHQVVVASPQPLNDKTLVNLTEIDLSYVHSEIMKDPRIQTRFQKSNYAITNIHETHKLLTYVLDYALKNTEVQQLIADRTDHFDLVIFEVLHDIGYAFAAKYGASFVGIASFSNPPLYVFDALGNPNHPVINPVYSFNVGKEMKFYDRLRSTFTSLLGRLYWRWYQLPYQDKLLRQYFGNDMPYLGDIQRNISLLLRLGHPILENIDANVPAVVDINQMHIKEPQALPKDLQKFLDESSEGVVYLSLGSNVKSSVLPVHVRDMIIRVFSKIPYKVLWKWETYQLPGKPDNVLIMNWVPQQDVLRHPNIKLFITQGGLQSLEEAITFGVPMVGMPYFADQPLNVKRMTELGVAEYVDYEAMTEDDLREAIMKVITNPDYKARVQEMRNILLDQPMKGVDKAVWWIEHVLRQKGARYLRSSAMDMPFYQYMLLDVYLFIICVLLIVLYISYKLYSIIHSLSVKKVKIN